MKTRVNFTFDIAVPEMLNFEQKNNLIGNILDKISSENEITPVEFTWRKVWERGQEN